MAYERFTDPDMFYVAGDGNYGGEDIIIASYSDFTEEQMDIISSLPDHERLYYARAILLGEDLSEWEDDFL